jgi:hypothetical protein
MKRRFFEVDLVYVPEEESNSNLFLSNHETD